jgi:hypothetical protein
MGGTAGRVARSCFVDLQSSKIGHPPVRREQRIMIRTELLWCTLPVNRGVEHAADVGTRDGAAMDTKTDKAARELVHHHEHPITPKHNRLASKQVHAPQAVLGVADERQPRGPGSASSRAIVFGQEAVHDVLVTSIPNVCEMISAIRGQSNRGLRDLSSTMA